MTRSTKQELSSLTSIGIDIGKNSAVESDQIVSQGPLKGSVSFVSGERCSHGAARQYVALFKRRVG